MDSIKDQIRIQMQVKYKIQYPINRFQTELIRLIDKICEYRNHWWQAMKLHKRMQRRLKLIKQRKLLLMRSRFLRISSPIMESVILTLAWVILGIMALIRVVYIVEFNCSALNNLLLSEQISIVFITTATFFFRRHRLAPKTYQNIQTLATHPPVFSWPKTRNTFWKQWPKQSWTRL